MKIILFLFLFVQFTLQCVAQDLPRFEIGAHLSVMQTYRSLKGKKNDISTIYIVDQRNYSEKPSFTLNYGLEIKKPFNRHFALVSGMDVQDFSYYIALDNLVYGNMIDPRKGETYPGQNGEIVGVKIFYHYQYLSLPLMAAYTLGEKRLKLTFKGGVFNQLLMKNFGVIEKTMKDGSQKFDVAKYDNPPRVYDIAGTIGIDLNYSFGKRNGITLQTYAITQLLGLGYSSILERQQGIGLGIGYVRSF